MTLSATLRRARGEFRLLEMIKQMFRMIELHPGVGDARKTGRERRMAARKALHFHLMASVALRVGERGEFRVRTAQPASRMARSCE